MMHFIIKWILRILPDKLRMKILVMAAMESALVRPGNHLHFEMTVDKNGAWSYKDNTPRHNNLNDCNAAGCQGCADDD